jgi:hypothetical protein
VTNTVLILGLGGIAGTLLGSVMPLFIERQRLAREETRTQQASRQEARQAARIVANEVRDAISAISTTIDSDSYWDPEDAPSRAAWLDHLPRLACDLTDDEYKAVSFAYNRVKLEIALNRAADHGPVNLYIESLEGTLAALESANRALARLAAMD